MAGEERPEGQPERGSFRDRDSRVFYVGGEVFRGLSEAGLDAWKHLAATEFFAREVRDGRIVGTERVDELSHLGSAAKGWHGVLRHQTVPFVSYPYEWCFGMLRDAAILQLELMAAALDEDMILKDASPYNVQWVGCQPVFIDVPSFVDLVPGEPWAGYRQFCELCLYPLFLQAYKDVAYHAWLRGSIDGIPAEAITGLFSARDLLRAGVFVHGYLHARLQSRYADSERDVRKELRDAGFHKELIVANVKRLLKLVHRLRWSRAQSTWSGYAAENTYDDANRELKAEFVRTAALDRPRKLVWDLGCNTGDYARIAADSADFVVAMDSDHLCVEHLYRRLSDEEHKKILPLVMPLNDASPNLGWRGRERKSLEQRGSPDLVLALALVHHMVIAANIPLAEFVDYLACLESDLVIEFVTKADPMVQKLLANKEDKYLDYDREHFERCLGERYDVLRRESLNDGLRCLYFARPRG